LRFGARPAPTSRRTRTVGASNILATYVAHRLPLPLVIVRPHCRPRVQDSLVRFSPQRALREPPARKTNPEPSAARGRGILDDVGRSEARRPSLEDVGCRVDPPSLYAGEGNSLAAQHQGEAPAGKNTFGRFPERSTRTWRRPENSSAPTFSGPSLFADKRACAVAAAREVANFPCRHPLRARFQEGRFPMVTVMLN
jgi:hypothetical protein